MTDNTNATPSHAAVAVTDQQIMQVWNDTPPQHDPSGHRFAIAFGRAILALPTAGTAAQDRDADARHGELVARLESIVTEIKYAEQHGWPSESRARLEQAAQFARAAMKGTQP